MRKIVTCIAAGLLVLGTAAVGQAQDRERRDQRGAKQQSNRAAERGTERRREVERGGERRRAAQQAGERRRGAEQANERRRAAEQAGQRRRAAEQANQRRRASDREDQRKRAAEQANERRRGAERENERRRAAGREDQRKRAAEQATKRKRAADREDQRKRAGEQVNERRRGAERENERKRAADREDQRRRAAEQANERRRAGEQAGERKRAAADDRAVKRDGKRHDPRFVELRRKRLELTRERRLHLRSAFSRDPRARIANARFARRIGTHIPRSVRLFVVPAAVISIFPDYRHYRYVVVEDEICIVDPVTYEIVDVIDEDDYAPPAGTSQSAQLTLTPAEQALVLDSIPPDFPEADVRLRLALGAEIPDRVELSEFAPIVLDNVPRLRDFRFIVTDDSMVIVDPLDRTIALVLER